MTAFRVCMIGAFYHDYPRHQIIRVGLERLGVEVDTVHIPLEVNTIRKLPHVAASWRHIRDCDVVLIAAFNELLAPVIWTVCQIFRKPVLLDYMIGLSDAIVHERSEGSPLKRVLNWQVDQFNIRAMPTLTDTAAHIELFEGIWQCRPKNMHVLPVGAYDTWYHEFPQSIPENPLLVQFFGNYIPFHGVDVIVDAIARFKGDSRVRFELIGRGKQYYEMCVQKAKKLELEHVTFVDRIPQAELPARIAQAAICLGVFGARTKTDYVVPNKVFQSMAIGRPVITAEAKAIHEFFTPGEHLVTVPTGDPDALAEAIRQLLISPEERVRIGQAGAARIREEFLPEHIGATLRAILAEVMDRRQF